MTNEQTEHMTLTLGDGTVLSIREVRPEDASALQRLFSRLSEQTIYLRYFGPKNELTDEKAHHIADVDGTNRYALVALDPEDEDEIVGLVGYDRAEEGSNEAEYAALIEDRMQGCGLGLGLTRLLIEAARQRGVRCLHALVLHENRGMLHLLRSLGLPESKTREEGTDRIDIDLMPEG